MNSVKSILNGYYKYIYNISIFPFLTLYRVVSFHVGISRIQLQYESI
jgi:hypothetical protein